MCMCTLSWVVEWSKKFPLGFFSRYMSIWYEPTISFRSRSPWIHWWTLLLWECRTYIQYNYCSLWSCYCSVYIPFTKSNETDSSLGPKRRRKKIKRTKRRGQPKTNPPPPSLPCIRVLSMKTMKMIIIILIVTKRFKDNYLLLPRTTQFFPYQSTVKVHLGKGTWYIIHVGVHDVYRAPLGRIYNRAHNRNEEEYEPWLTPFSFFSAS